MSLQMVAWVPALVALAGCQTASTAPDDAVAHQAEPPDELAYDPARAFLRLNEIVPDPPAPRGPEPGAAQLSPEGARRLSRARSLYSEQRFSEAATELEKALRQEPDHPVLHREAALAWRAAEEHRRVRPHLTKALEGDGDDIVTHYLLGRLAFEDQQQPDAIGHYRLALKASNAAAHPAFAAACRFHLAKALNAEGYLTAAIEQYRAFEDAVASLPDEARSNREIEALLAINDGRAGKPISVAYEKLGRYEEAADALTDAYRDREPDPGTREHLARLLARTGRYEAALTQARLLARQSDRAIELLIELHEDAGHAELVLEDLGALYAQNPDRQNILIAHADALERFGRLEEAKALLLDAVDREATGPELYWRLIDLFQQTGEPHRALEIATAAVRRFPGVFDTAKAKTTAFAESPDAVASLLGDAQSEPLADSDAVSAALLGVLAERVGRCEQAQRYLEYAVRAEPALKPARIELAELLLQRFQWQAVTDLVTVDEEALRGDARLARLCGEAYAGLDDFENATQQLNAAIRLNRSDVEAMVALAGVYREADQVHQAASQYEKILELNPLHEASREKLIEYYLVDPQGRREDALHQLGELKRLNASPHRIARCEALIERGEGESIEDWRAYRETLERAITEHGPDAETYARIAGSHLSELQFDEASEALDRAVAAEPNNMDALELRVPAYQLTLQYDRAVEHLKGLLRRHPNRNRWIGQLWQVLMNDHRFREAYELASERLARPGLPDELRDRYREQCVRALSRGGHFAELVAILRQWREDEPEDRQAVALLIDALGDAGRHDQAVEEAYRLHADEPRDDVVLATLQSALTRAGRFDQAMHLVLDRLETAPLDPVLRQQMVYLLTFAERYDEALELLDNVEFGSQNAPAWIETRIGVLEHARRYEEALGVLSAWIQEVRQAQFVDPGRLAYWQRRMAINKCRLGRFEEAAADLTRWMEESVRQPIRARYVQTLSVCYTFQGDTDRAIETLRQMHELNLRDVGVNNDLGYSLADADRHLDEAERMIRYAVALRPDNGAYLDSLGWVLYKKGRFAEAREWLEKARATIEYVRSDQNGDDPADGVIHDHMGDVYWKLGMVEEAVRSWEKAARMLAEAPDLALAAQTRRALERVNAKLEAIEEGGEPETASVVATPDDS